jgi:hypothetical protein
MVGPRVDLRAFRQAIGRGWSFPGTYGHPPRWMDQLMDRDDGSATTHAERMFGIGLQTASLSDGPFFWAGELLTKPRRAMDALRSAAFGEHVIDGATPTSRRDGLPRGWR